MKLAIKNPAPLGPDLDKWGDYHFGNSLQRALEARGVEVVQHYWPQWEVDDGGEVELVLHGKRQYVPSGRRPALLWIISHPASIDIAGLDNYSLVYASSALHRSLLAAAVSAPVELMRQCTDTALFHPPARSLEEDLERRREVIYVANSRGTRRDMPLWALDAGVTPRLYGRHWDKCGMGHLVTDVYVGNDRLPELYRASRLSLNDHWVDMKHFGIINNRIFDCLACGLPVLSDSHPELRETFGDTILYANSAAEFRDAIGVYRERYRSVLENALAGREIIENSYSFDARAEQIAAQALSPPGPGKGRTTSFGRREALRVESTMRENVTQQLRRNRDIERVANKALKEQARAVETSTRHRDRARRDRLELARLRREHDELVRYAWELERRGGLGRWFWRVLGAVRVLRVPACRILTRLSGGSVEVVRRPKSLAEYERSLPGPVKTDTGTRAENEHGRGP